ncbi:hypothetical protein [Flavobacterium tructae]|uniref:Alpha-L-rhamnosidase six-hairpin glycosidase domain-containing protein n=1 Tax=Flavobacterium tructae TaxID=1114873 RepID=A0A1S1J647_9FLAO|nr:hypothetical protein [Flavobacterium tructae]OHT44969.1 hypothetical protein BHE19_09645 [Flavobacterium tructae]OXB19003.1 hypothetical protein B0A71_13765 [Flavobacterium tructae]
MKRFFEKKQKHILFVLVAFCFVAGKAFSQEDRRWLINPDGTISWQINNNIPHDDHIEMSGKKISAVLRYGVAADGSFHATRSLIWPMLRTIPNNTHASLTRRFAQDGFNLVTVNYKPIVAEKVTSLTLDGTLLVKSKVGNTLELTRQFFPSTTLAGYFEIYTLKNISEKTCAVEIPKSNTVYTTDPEKGTEGSYTLHVDLANSGSFNLKTNEVVRFSVFYSGVKTNEQVPVVNAEEEKEKRTQFINQIWSKLILETPDPVLNTEFAFAKIRASESIFETKGGPMHGPGGESYYAAIWANDQAEYIGPFFPFLGYEYGNQASLNAYLQFAKFMNKEYQPIPSSIVAEGTDIWAGAGDRGDGAMIAYGAARYALSRGNTNEAKQLWPLIEWCLEYCHRKLNSDGIVTSDSDELEGRLPAGKANLNTSSLYYDALNSAVYLGKALGKNEAQLKTYKAEAEKLKAAIEKYFGAKVEGFETYKYYKENDILRAWICTPLAMGIYDRKEGTIEALFSPRLWTKDGLASIAGDKIFWDRSTLYALRGVLAAGETDKALDFLHYYSNRRLLGDHVPYPVEAYPEGDQRHLSAESGLYCRIFTEGLFGIRPTALNSFDFTPRLPKSWPMMKLRHINAFEHDFDITVERVDKKLKITISEGRKIITKKIIEDGSTINISLQ